MAEEQQTKTHQQAPYTLIDGAADTSYVSDETLIQRSMGEMITTSQQDMMVSSGDGHHQVSSESLAVVADGQFSMTNGKDNIMLSAHTGKLEATAKQDVNMSSSTKEVEVVATNKITLTAGGASITLDGGDITIAAMQFTEKAGKHSRDGGGMDGQGLAGLPTTPTAYRLRFHLKNDDEVPYSYTPYIITNENTDEKFEGITDNDGHTETYYSSTPDGFNVHLQIEGIKYGE
ncbi:DUF2345 domain-containing protein [Psychrobacter sp. AOP7-B1-24]|uniref:DUF2345 domain-containing protein n=1 Tax=Psychrobacter sp. AOP7-B1-24 TaxID=3457645 RepID=UPI00402B10D0